MKAPEGIQFCVGCPLVPEGVIAQVNTASYTDMAEYRSLADPSEISGFVENYVDTSITIVSTCVESTNPDVEVGDDAIFRIERNGQSEEEAIEATANCTNPKKGRIAKVLGTKGVCQAVRAK
jgi:acylphosphatase